MLSYQLLKNHAGILLCGDYSSLETLQRTIHEVNEQSPLIKDKEGTFLALAYDARKAYQGQRELIKPPENFKEVGTRYGVEILWPVLLLQCRMLRSSLGYFDSTKLQQAMTYWLEALIEEALAEDFGTAAPAIIEQWHRIDPAHPWAEEKLDSRGAQYCAWSKAERKAMLATLLASLDPMYPAYYQGMLRQGAKNLVSPETLDAFDGVEWADPRW